MAYRCVSYANRLLRECSPVSRALPSHVTPTEFGQLVQNAVNTQKNIAQQIHKSNGDRTNYYIASSNLEFVKKLKIIDTIPNPKH